MSQGRTNYIGQNIPFEIYMFYTVGQAVPFANGTMPFVLTQKTYAICLMHQTAWIYPYRLQKYMGVSIPFANGMD